MSECLHCGVQFQPRRRGHVFCTPRCRHRGARKPEDRIAVDSEQIARLFDEGRDPDAQVREDDWHPSPPAPDGLGYFPSWGASDSPSFVAATCRSSLTACLDEG